MMEVFMIVLQHSDSFYKTSLVNLSPVSVWNLNICNKSHSYRYCSLRYYLAELTRLTCLIKATKLSMMLGSQLDYLVMQSRISHPQTSYFSKLIHRCYVLV